MRELMTTLLDFLGVLLVAAGVGAAFWLVMGWSALAIVGLVILAASWGITLLDESRRR